MCALSSPKYGTISVRAELLQRVWRHGAANKRMRSCRSLQVFDRGGKLGKDKGKGGGIVGQQFMRMRRTNCLLQGRNTAIGGGRQNERRRRTPKERKDGRCDEGNMEGNRKTARDGESLYLEKAAERPTRDALPERGAPSPFGRPLGWKQEPAALSPSAPI
ncbi:hypothetical protein MMC28_010587 [Mycoblastus sanguinarius]|nr:hypothetical protein [Mycoblastus sanguinarius]